VVGEAPVHVTNLSTIFFSFELDSHQMIDVGNGFPDGSDSLYAPDTNPSAGPSSMK
jgi:hypothetical protein